MISTNLLEETLSVLSRNGKTESDVLWAGSMEIKLSWDNFAKLADVEYDAGFGTQEVATDLIVVGDDWWLERIEYNGSEWWSFKTKIKEPIEFIEVFSLISSSGFETLVQFNTPYSDDDDN